MVGNVLAEFKVVKSISPNRDFFVRSIAKVGLVVDIIFVFIYALNFIIFYHFSLHRPNLSCVHLNQSSTGKIST